jgi:hypothetical protein
MVFEFNGAGAQVRLKEKDEKKNWGHPLKGLSREKTPPRSKKSLFD